MPRELGGPYGAVEPSRLRASERSIIHVGLRQCRVELESYISSLRIRCEYLVGELAASSRVSLARSGSQSLWRVYLLTCSDGSLYCGSAVNVEQRLRKHNSGRGSKYVRSHLPAELLAVSQQLSKSNALSMELKLKRQPAASKLDVLLASGGELYRGKCEENG